MTDPAAPLTGHARRRHRRTRLRLVLVLMLGSSLVLCFVWKPLLVAFAFQFRVHDPVPSDILVVLTGGEDDRAVRAGDLYRRGFARVVLICSDSDTNTNVRNMVEAGIPPEAIQPLGAVGTTYDEALCVRNYVRANSVRRITLVTTAYHTARARRVFRRVLRGSGAEVHVAASEDARFNESNWFGSAAGRRFYVRELFKTIYYRLAY